MKKVLLKTIIFNCWLLLLLSPFAVLGAQSGEFTAIQAVPFVEDGSISFVRHLDTSEYSTADFLNGLFTLVIAGAALLVVVRLILAGVQYMFTDLITTKAKAKKDIQNALLGLLVILGSVTILNTINPELTNLNALRTAAPLGGSSDDSGNSECTDALRALTGNGACECGQRYQIQPGGNHLCIDISS